MHIYKETHIEIYFDPDDREDIALANFGVKVLKNKGFRLCYEKTEGWTTLHDSPDFPTRKLEGSKFGLKNETYRKNLKTYKRIIDVEV